MVEDVTQIGHRIHADPPLHVVLYQPVIPQNTGNIARLCAATDVTLHLIHPLGFRVDNRHLKRAGLDYWREVDVRHHQNLDAFFSRLDQVPHGRLIAFSRHATADYPEAIVRHGDYLLFGRETDGLPHTVMTAHPCFKIPIWGNVRSLNLSNAAAIIVYHWLHRLERF